ncbi:protein of unknown function [Blastococcus saxobsidens DD2]|uniref:Uncharacterized protein n=1 Tax=Blastococcus saxobsidens (strain DD2) TaxID=1146883 RepID=H6RKF2_BLASD|nr:protein of unknown function [Blastococcus saxobsidens DD2]
MGPGRAAVTHWTEVYQAEPRLGFDRRGRNGHLVAVPPAHRGRRPEGPRHGQRPSALWNAGASGPLPR